MIRILLLHVSAQSGHFRATLALRRALGDLAPGVSARALDAFAYANPILARLVRRAYLGLLAVVPQVWDILYDHPALVRRTQVLRRGFHGYNARKIAALLDAAQPSVVACTQAFPCGMVADYKRRSGRGLPLMAVLTDFAPHGFWVDPQVDAYVVPCEAARERLQAQGVPAARIRELGIPVHHGVADHGGPERQGVEAVRGAPLVLVMGGGRGLGPLGDIVDALDGLEGPCRVAVLTGSNERLLGALQHRARRARHPLTPVGCTEEVAGWMAQATILITKPGGLTTAEALAHHLPMVLISPIGGQEAGNAKFLTRHGAAVEGRDPREVARLVGGLLRDPAALGTMRRHARVLAHPNAAMEIARWLLDLAGVGVPAPGPQAVGAGQAVG